MFGAGTDTEYVPMGEQDDLWRGPADTTVAPLVIGTIGAIGTG